MKVYRNSVFETNSSSVHSLIIKRNTKGIYDYKVKISKKGDVLLFDIRDVNFDWGLETGPAEYNSTIVKLNYLACLAFQCWQYHTYGTKGSIKKVSEIYEIPDLKKIEKVCRKNIVGFNRFVFYSKAFDRYKDGLHFNNYDCIGIDHQSYEDFNSIDDFLKYHKISMENFLFNPYVTLKIYHDNGE